MKSFGQLTEKQQGKALEVALNELLDAVCAGAIRFDDGLNSDDLQARIDAAIAKAEEMQTPWFAGEYVMDTCREDLESMARADAEDALYPESKERTIANVA